MIFWAFHPTITFGPRPFSSRDEFLFHTNAVFSTETTFSFLMCYHSTWRLKLIIILKFSCSQTQKWLSHSPSLLKTTKNPQKKPKAKKKKTHNPHHPKKRQTNKNPKTKQTPRNPKHVSFSSKNHVWKTSAQLQYFWSCKVLTGQRTPWTTLGQ